MDFFPIWIPKSYYSSLVTLQSAIFSVTTFKDDVNRNQQALFQMQERASGYGNASSYVPSRLFYFASLPWIFPLLIG